MRALLLLPAAAALLGHPPGALGAVNEYVVSSSPPGVVDSTTIHFDEVLPTGATIKWQQADLGNYGLPVSGYRLRYSADRDFPKVTTPTHLPTPANDAMDPSTDAWSDVPGVSSGAETDYQVRPLPTHSAAHVLISLFTPLLCTGGDLVPDARPRAGRAVPVPDPGAQPLR